MGASQNSNVSPEQKQKVLKDAGKLDALLDKPAADLKPMDHNELDLAYDKHLLEIQASGANNKPHESHPIDPIAHVDSPPPQSPDASSEDEEPSKKSKKGKR